ncbi:MAG TPA: hypothetical protein DEB40_07035 [Elusimicrobia bacterium]|nr:hypothetical protein [Elusimicrobiota bacterium]HBT61482.1 hypothetical protein [Elusimicrobiota bacterium]
MKIHPDFSDFIAALNRHRVEFVIVGAFDLAFLGSPRYTGDMDVWIRPTAPNARALLRAIEDFGLKSLALAEQDVLSGKIIQMGYPPVRIDLLTLLDGLTADEIWASRQKGPLGGHTVNYMGRAAFVKNKRAAGRQKDLADLEALGEPPEAAG